MIQYLIIRSWKPRIESELTLRKGMPPRQPTFPFLRKVLVWYILEYLGSGQDYEARVVGAIRAWLHLPELEVKLVDRRTNLVW